MSEQQKIDTIKKKLQQIAAEIAECRRILRGEEPQNG